jgi:hypothetical protein
MITWNRTPTNYEVQGPYGEMVEINAKLKRKGFRWDSGKKVWYCPVNSLSEADWDKLQGKVAPKAPKPGKKPVDPKVLEDLFDQAANLPLKRIKVQRRGDGVRILGPVSGLAKQIQKAGGSTPGDSSWYVITEHVVPKAFKDLMVQMQEADQAIDEAYQKREDLFKQALGLKLIGFRFSPGNVGHSLFLEGETRSLAQICRSAGGTWSGKAWEFSLDSMNPTGFQELLESVEEASNRVAVKAAKEAAKMEELLKKARNRWPTLNVWMSPNGQGTYGFSLNGDTRAVKDHIRNENMAWGGSAWHPNTPYFTSENMENLVYLLDKQEEKALKTGPAAKPEPARKVNTRPDRCTNCGLMVPAGAGYLWGEYDDDKEAFVYRVVHQDKDSCNAARERAREEARLDLERHKSRSQAMNALRDHAHKGETPKLPAWPQGRKLVIDDRSVGYGGGQWVVVEPNQDHYWYIQGNGADGDDWSHNNLPGAIGWKAEITPEVWAWVEVLTGEKP